MTSKTSQRLSLAGNDWSSNHEMIVNHVSQNPNIIELDISNCELHVFPKEFWKLKKLCSLDIRNNHFDTFEDVVDAWASFVNLTDLKIDLTDQSQVLLILGQIPKLVLLNGKSTKDAVTIVDVDEKDVEHIFFEGIYPQAKQMLSTWNKDNDNGITKEFEKWWNDQTEVIQEHIENNSPNYWYGNVVIQSEFKVFKHWSDLFLRGLTPEQKQVGGMLFDNIFKAGEDWFNWVNTLYPKIEEKTEILRNQLEEAWKAADEITDFEEKFKNVNKEKELVEEEKNIIKNKLEHLETENKIMTEKLIKSAKNICEVNLTTKGNVHGIVQTNINTTNPNAKQSHTMPNKTNKNINTNTNTNWSNQNNNVNTVVIPMSSKTLTIRMMKEIMNEIYNSKAFFDKKCFENKQPRETMEQHMYTYLNQKYGLKNLIIEWASSIINALKIYSSEDSDINWFGKILRNEQEEDSKWILMRLRTTVSDLLEYYIKSKNPLKSTQDIKSILEQKKEGTLTEEEWKGIVYYIYNQEDAQMIEGKINSYISKSSKKQSNSNNFFSDVTNNTNTHNNNISTPLSNSGSTNKKLTREEIFNWSRAKEEIIITYKDFIKVVSDHQIKSREKYLRNFVRIFRKIDIDSDGVLNEDEFINWLKSIPVCNDKLEEYSFKFLSIIDPFNNKKITFSECVSLFSMEMIEGNEGKTRMSLLDKICLEEEEKRTNQ